MVFGFDDMALAFLGEIDWPNEGARDSGSAEFRSVRSPDQDAAFAPPTFRAWRATDEAGADPRKTNALAWARDRGCRSLNNGP